MEYWLNTPRKYFLCAMLLKVFHRKQFVGGRGPSVQSAGLLGPDYMSQAASGCRDDSKLGII